MTMAIAVTARTAFSLLLPALVGEFKWERGLVAGAFPFGFLISAALSPIVGRLTDRRGPRVVIGGPAGVVNCVHGFGETAGKMSADFDPMGGFFGAEN